MNETCPECGKPVPPSALGGLCPECMLRVGAEVSTEKVQGFGPFGTKVVPTPLAVKEIAALFPQLEILEQLGRGGMGIVYKARQPRLNRCVALKVVAPEKEKDPQFSERFAREAQALARLNHPNIVTVYDFGETNGLFYLLMEYVDGASLRELMAQHRITPQQALALVPKICEALQYAHEQGIVHRDIKPENILLDQQGRIKIADFGIAKLVGRMHEKTPVLTGASQVMGSPHYMAPEQLERPATVDHRADIFSLGVVFYEMLTGELPLGKFDPPSQKVCVDVRLDQVVLHALEKEPERRYQHASEVKSDVESIADSEGSSARSDPLKSSAGLHANHRERAVDDAPGWASWTASFWPPVVVQRDGKRAIHWPAIIARTRRSVLMLVFFSIVAGAVNGFYDHHGIALLGTVFLTGIVTISLVNVVRIVQGLSQPLHLLPSTADLNRPSQAAGKTGHGIPGAIWFALIILGILILGKLGATAVVGERALANAAINGVVLVGLATRRKWGYALMFVSTMFEVCALAACGSWLGVENGPAAFVPGEIRRTVLTLVLDLLVIIPITLKTSWFLPPTLPKSTRLGWLWGTVILSILAGFAGYYRLLPALTLSE